MTRTDRCPENPVGMGNHGWKEEPDRPGYYCRWCGTHREEIVK